MSDDLEIQNHDQSLNTQNGSSKTRNGSWSSLCRSKGVGLSYVPPEIREEQKVVKVTSQDVFD